CFRVRAAAVPRACGWVGPTEPSRRSGRPRPPTSAPSQEAGRTSHASGVGSDGGHDAGVGKLVLRGLFQLCPGFLPVSGVPRPGASTRGAPRARCGRRPWGCRPSVSEKVVLEAASWARGFWRSDDLVGSPTPNGPASRWRSQPTTAQPELGPHGRAQLGTEREGHHRVGTPGGGRGVDHEQSSTTLGAGPFLFGALPRDRGGRLLRT